MSSGVPRTNKIPTLLLTTFGPKIDLIQVSTFGLPQDYGPPLMIITEWLIQRSAFDRCEELWGYRGKWAKNPRRLAREIWKKGFVLPGCYRQEWPVPGRIFVPRNEASFTRAPASASVNYDDWPWRRYISQGPTCCNRLIFSKHRFLVFGKKTRWILRLSLSSISRRMFFPLYSNDFQHSCLKCFQLQDLAF